MLFYILYRNVSLKRKEKGKKKFNHMYLYAFMHFILSFCHFTIFSAHVKDGIPYQLRKYDCQLRKYEFQAFPGLEPGWERKGCYHTSFPTSSLYGF